MIEPTLGNNSPVGNTKSSFGWKGENVENSRRMFG